MLNMYTQEELKVLVAKEAVARFVKSGMTVGLGTGSTAKYVVIELGRKLKNGELNNVMGVPTSNATRDLAIENEVPLFDGLPDKLDLTIDGADRINLETGDCLKGWGGAHYVEKRIAKLGSRMVVIVDSSKLCTSFAGEKIPLEVMPEQLNFLREELELKGLEHSVREVLSDSKNYLVDVVLPANFELTEFHAEMMKLPGVLDTGVFSGIVTDVVVSDGSGEVGSYSIL